jgi:hypothetical protein
VGIPAEGRHNLADFSEIAVLANLILDPPAHTVDLKELSLATVGGIEQMIRLDLYHLRNQEPLRQCFCKHFAARTPD